MLSNRPSTFDRSESKSNGAARPWSTLRDLLLERHKEWPRINQQAICRVLHINHVTVFFFNYSTTFQPVHSLSLSHTTYSSDAIKFQIVQLTKVVNIERGMSLELIQVLSSAEIKVNSKGVLRQRSLTFREFQRKHREAMETFLLDIKRSWEWIARSGHANIDSSEKISMARSRSTFGLIITFSRSYFGT